jgi:glycosyltransferase involved in cell wall biosynthesis
LRILQIIPSYFPAIKFGGPIQSVHQLIKELVNKGIQVDVMTTDAGLSQEQRKKILRQAQDDEEKWNDVDGVRVKYLPFLGYEHYNFSLQMIKEVWKIINYYDLVHITAVWNFPVLAGSLISLIKKKPYIISPRGVFHQEALSSKSTLTKKFYFILFAKQYLKRAAGIHYTTTVEKEESEQLIKHSNGFIVPNGIDLSIIQKSHSKELLNEFGISDDKKYILILGRIDRIKGFDLLLPAFAQLVIKNNNLNLVITGDCNSPYTAEVKQMIEEHKISSKVIFTGQVIGDDKWTLYKNALMFVLPSYSENFGMSVIEAMACGCPVVISDKVGIYKDIEKEEAGIVVVTNPGSIVAGIKRILEDVELRNKISFNALNLVKEKYDIEKVAVQIIEQYKRVLANA